MPPPEPTAVELAGLADKYHSLLKLRAARDSADEVTADRRTLRELSRRYPGCLRELDTLGLLELDRRATAAHEAATGTGPRQPWMAWILAFHSRLAAALADKSSRSDSPRVPGGRLTPVILEQVARDFSVPLPEVTATLFPSRHREATEN